MDEVLAAGYDGVYLDIVDAYEYWEPGGPGVPDYVQAASDIGKEDLFYDGNSRQPAAETSSSIRQLDRFKETGKPVFVIDYITRRVKIDAFYEKAHARGYVPYATRRDLDVLTINLGHAPD